MHNTRPLELGDLVTQKLTHSAYLTIKPLGENDSKLVFAGRFNDARFCYRS